MKASVSVAISCLGVRVARTAGRYAYFVQTEVPAGNVIDSGGAAGVNPLSRNHFLCVRPVLHLEKRGVD